MSSQDEQAADQEPWFLKSGFPVLFPSHPALTLSEADFQVFLKGELHPSSIETDTVMPDNRSESDSLLLLSAPSTSAEVRHSLEKVVIDADEEPESISATGDSNPAKQIQETPIEHPFMKGLLAHADGDNVPRDVENKMRTENGDLAFRSTNSALLDLFVELEEVVSGPRLHELLNLAWEVDPLATLKIIFNARSIHLGKSSQSAFYRCAGWLAQRHPQTLIANLRWLSRPVIEKKARKQEEGVDAKDGQTLEQEMVLVENENDYTRFDVQNGVSHGYWKDLLNILVISANGLLDVLSNPREGLNKTSKAFPDHGASLVKRGRMRKRAKVDSQADKLGRHELRDERHRAVHNAFQTNAVHRCLHLAVARLFAEQLKTDLVALRDGDAKAKRHISLCAKWAPSHNRSHDKQTFVVSTIAEMLHPESEFSDCGLDGLSGDERRTLYLRHARGAYTQDVAALRAHLEVVERDLSANTLGNIKYERVPSLAMKNYAAIFASKDTERFTTYIEKVAQGKARISGAILLPSTLVATADSHNAEHDGSSSLARLTSASDMVQQKLAELQGKVVDGQWRTLVQRVRDSGALDNAIAVCDVSGSMQWPRFPDGTTPMESAVGLSLLVAEVTAPPFGGAFIAFSSSPVVQRVDLSLSLREKVQSLKKSTWDMNTDFVAVFEELILPLAVEHKLRQEDMVKRVFVFSDMQFDQAAGHFGSMSWNSSYDRIKGLYAQHGYEMPQLVFWNLAGGRAGYHQTFGDPIAPKPVTATEPGTAMVSGYSQGMLKVFLDKGMFEEPDEDEDEILEVVDEAKDGGIVVVEKAKKDKIDPLGVMWKAISHKSYAMLEVVD